MAHRQHPRDAVGRRGALLDQRLRDRRAGRRALTDERERVGSDERGLLEEIEDQIGGVVCAERARKRTRRRGGDVGRGLLFELGCAFDLQGGSLEGVIGMAPARLDASAVSEQREVGVQNGVAEEEREHSAQRQERHERDAHLAGRGGAVPPDENGSGNERREEPDHERDCHGRAESGTEQERELHVSEPEPLRIREHDEKEPPCCQE
jgi:hypothetical protein